MNKKLEKDSEYASYDTDGDGVVTDEELETSKELQQLKLDPIKQMHNGAWLGLLYLECYYIHL